MPLVLESFRYATVEELFEFKSSGFTLPAFPGYSDDQWGIKAHNRPWIAAHGAFAPGQRIIEVGGAYSTLPAHLAKRFDLEAWIGDDFGKGSPDEQLWSRWGRPEDLQRANPDVKYVLEPLGRFSPSYPDRSFDRVFSVSTLEHIPWEALPDVFRDMHRLLARGGVELHSIDIPVSTPRRELYEAAVERAALRVPPARIPDVVARRSHALRWLKLIEDSGVDVGRIARGGFPYSEQKLDRETLVESYDVVYRFHPPNDRPKRYSPSASLLVVIRDV